MSLPHAAPECFRRQNAPESPGPVSSRPGAFWSILESILESMLENIMNGTIVESIVVNAKPGDIFGGRVGGW